MTQTAKFALTLKNAYYDTRKKIFLMNSREIVTIQWEQFRHIFKSKPLGARQLISKKTFNGFARNRFAFRYPNKYAKGKNNDVTIAGIYRGTVFQMIRQRTSGGSQVN